MGTSVIESLGADPHIAEIFGLASRVPQWTAPKTTWYSVDVATDDLDEYFNDVDVVIHLAWLFQPTRDPRATWRNSASPPHNNGGCSQVRSC